jgi:hypothetical protein
MKKRKRRFWEISRKRTYSNRGRPGLGNGEPEVAAAGAAAGACDRGWHVTVEANGGVGRATAITGSNVEGITYLAWRWLPQDRGAESNGGQQRSPTTRSHVPWYGAVVSAASACHRPAGTKEILGICQTSDSIQQTIHCTRR